MNEFEKKVSVNEFLSTVFRSMIYTTMDVRMKRCSERVLLRTDRGDCSSVSIATTSSLDTTCG